MGNSLLAWVNQVKTAVLAATSAEPALPVTNLTGDQGSAASGWQTLAGALTPVLTITPLVQATVRAVGIFRTNLTAAASVVFQVFSQAADTSLDINFINGSSIDPRIVFTRASGASYFDATGTLATAANNVPRIDWGPTPGAAPLGLLIEEARTNSIRNPRAEGAIAGTPGTLPTNWSVLNTGGLSYNVIGRGSESGIPYWDVQIVGTSSSTISRIASEANNVIAAAVSQAWTTSCYLRVVGGTLANIVSVQHQFGAYSSTPTLLTLYSGTAFLPTTAPLASQRSSFTGTITDATAAFVQGEILWLTLSGTGVAVNVTLRIGAPQLERGVFLSSAILPVIGSPAATARGTETVSVLTSGFTYNASAGSLAIEWIHEGTTNSFGSPLQLVGATPNTDWINVDTLTTGTPTAPQLSSDGIAVGGVSIGATFGGSIVMPAGTIQRGAMTWSVGSPINGSHNGVSATPSANLAATPAVTKLTIAGPMHFQSPPSIWARRVRYWPRVLSTADLTAVTDPAGGLQASITLAPVNGQAVAILNADTAADSITVSISDPGNPDNHINVPLAFAGAAWQPLTAMAWSSSVGRDSVSDVVTTRGGQTFVDIRASFRRWEIALDGVRLNEVYTQLDPLQRAIPAGGNVLVCPDITSPNLQYEATFGILKPTADVTFPLGIDSRRSWRASLSERL